MQTIDTSHQIDKSSLLALVNRMPENFTLEELINELDFIQNVKQGLKDSEEGRIYTESEVRNKLNKWLK